jgi:hypothetical protein
MMMSWGVSVVEVDWLPDGRMDTENAATYTGRSVKTLAQWRCRRIGPRYVKRGRIYYYKDDLDAWLRGGLCDPKREERGSEAK